MRHLPRATAALLPTAAATTGPLPALLAVAPALR